MDNEKQEDFKRILTHSPHEIKTDNALMADFIAVADKYYPDQNCTTCPGVFESIYGLIEKSYNKFLQISLIMINSDSKFQLKKEHTLFCENRHASFNNSNLTDEVAILILKEQPLYAIYFEMKPDNWKELCDEAEFPPSFAEEVAAQKAEKDQEKKEEKLEVIKTELSGSLNKAELQAKAKELNLPEEEWSSLTKSELLKYLLSKVEEPSNE